MFHACLETESLTEPNKRGVFLLFFFFFFKILFILCI